MLAISDPAPDIKDLHRTHDTHYWDHNREASQLLKHIYRRRRVVTASHCSCCIMAAQVIPPRLAAVAGEVAKLLKARKETISVAETAAGGLVSAALLATPGASVSS